jgi:hypothetical protein
MMTQPLIMAVLVSQHRADLMRRAEQARAVQAGRRTHSRGNSRGWFRRRPRVVPAVVLRCGTAACTHPARAT